MKNYLLQLLWVFLIIVAYCLFVGLYDRQYQNMPKKRDWLIGIIVVSAGIFSATITSSLYFDGWGIKYLAPILLYAAATAAVIAYTCLLKKIYAVKSKNKEDKEKGDETNDR